MLAKLEVRTQGGFGQPQESPMLPEQLLDLSVGPNDSMNLGTSATISARLEIQDPIETDKDRLDLAHLP